MESQEKQKPRILWMAGLCLAYIISGKLGLKLAFVHASATAVWPPTGLALAAFLTLGYAIWPAVFLGAFVVNLTTAGTIATSLGIAAGNTLEGVVGCHLVKRFANGPNAFGRAQDIFKFAFWAAMVSTTVSSTIGVTTISLGGIAQWKNFPAIWITWWLGDAVGALLVAPLLLLWIANPRVRWRRKQAAEAVLMSLTLSLIAWTIFAGTFHPLLKNYPLEFLCIPPIVWAAFRFGRRAAMTAVAGLAVVATWGTLHGYGPFARETQHLSLLLLQSFIGCMALMKLAIAAEVRERRRTQRQVEHLAVSDALTGLANYRRLVDVLDAERNRSARSGKGLAVLMLDMDGLKRINDQYGHLAGSRAVCRLADVLRVHCREMDTAARYGGDEFVLVLPEAGENEAREVAKRIKQRLADDRDSPALSVSIGAAVYPRDGETVEELLAAADRDLYAMKRQQREESPLRLGHRPRSNVN